MIKMFMLKFLNSLPQPLGNNPWLAHLTNQNFKTRFHRQCNYLLRYQAPKKRSNSILKKKRLWNELNVEGDPYETPTLAYNKELYQLVEVNTITNEVEEDSTTYIDVEMTKLDDKEESMMPKTQSP